MGPNPLLGVIFHWIGGLMAASFYIPYRSVKRWSWETYWLVGGFFSWLVAPWIFAVLLVPDLTSILERSPTENLFWAYFFGVLWGIGGLTFGLTMRYLGIALGYAIALGLCAVFGTIVPPIFDGEFAHLLRERSGQTVLLGVLVCLVGIGFSGVAGMSKEREMTDAQKKQSVSEFNFLKGLAVAVFAGVMSACMAYGFRAGKPIAELAKSSLVAHGRMDLWQNLPVLIIVLLGGFTTNFFWCMFLTCKKRSWREYVAMPTDGALSANLILNYGFSALAGVTWYLQFFFYSMGQTKMGKYAFSSWTLHMASIIIFSTLWGVALREWKGTSKRTHLLIAIGLAVLIASTVIVGYGNYIKLSVG